MYSIEELNDVQKRAVLDTEGAVLVTAGAGSGKTRLLTHRIAHLVNDLGVKPYNILAITFTNKAAEEMRNRLDGMINTDGLWIFTFHAACVRILRSYIDKIGFDKNFTIYGEAETKSVVKRICKEHGYDDDIMKHALSAISSSKNKGIAPDEYQKVFMFAQDAEEIGNIYKEYCTALKANNALDYDDLLIYALRLLKTDATAREFYQNKFRYIHIDEFQDTNVIQYEIVKLLAGKYGNVFAVGDEDQCIYTWRGASIDNIFDFQKDFDCKVYKLEQNYRSSENILAVANRIIKGNTQRLDKKLWTQKPSGAKVVCFEAQTGAFEADFVVRTIFDLVRDGEYNYSDIAILMRINALSRTFEERFLQYGIPHRVYGGFKFYERKEIKDVLAYARLAVNHADDEAAYRIINFPRRQIGEASIEKLREYTQAAGISVFDAVTRADSLPFNNALVTKLKSFGNVLAELDARASGDITGFFGYLLNDVLHVNDLFADDSEREARLENLGELINSVRDFCEKNSGAQLFDYLQMVSLYSDTDEMNGDNAVTIATVHSAKGLEFPAVFVVGLEDGIFPSIRMNESTADRMEEERRLMYVAVTRAKERLFLTHAKTRFLYGETTENIPSRFLVEAGLVVRKSDSRDAYTASPSYRGGSGNIGSRQSGYGQSSYDSANRGGSAPSFGEKFSGTYKSDIGKKPAAKSGADSSVKDKIREGVTVSHRRLGRGKVVGIERMGDTVYAKIDFVSGGVMLLAVDCAPLTVVED